MGKKLEFRDVSLGLQKLREFLLGRKHTLHGRFTPLLAPRSLPPADIPRGPGSKYSNKYYFQRNVYNSVKPPVVAPVAEGPPIIKDPTKKAPCGTRAESITFNSAPTPGPAWWWDGHCCYETVPIATSSRPPPQGADPYCPQTGQTC